MTTFDINAILSSETTQDFIDMQWDNSAEDKNGGHHTHELFINLTTGELVLDTLTTSEANAAKLHKICGNFEWFDNRFSHELEDFDAVSRRINATIASNINDLNSKDETN